MKILIVEDDEEKAHDLTRFIQENYISSEISIAKSFQSGLRAVFAGNIDLILLDMTMRNYDRSVEEDGGRPHHFAGREILRQMAREEALIPVIVVTHFDRFGEETEEVTLIELKGELKKRFPHYLGTVHYRSNVDDWKLQLTELISAHLPEYL
ncbi:response regulator [Methylobacterium sp. J-092]|uniref:response regulator n=1 Tax=Methylobacterium sp. J-092 TaxID=2836667 RepID=UPI001FB9C8C1|nr:response regulator [Methylobacterium sp. J-092]MCJ2007967.1 response regulator [Methylobacterium sp. J-092]